MQTDFLLRLRPDRETATVRPCQAPEHPCVVSDVKLEHAAARQRIRLAGEAHRHVPSGRLEEDSKADRPRSLLRRSVRETRKYGIGWFFISQTLGGLENEILQQLRILAFGFGLAIRTGIRPPA